jgi:hypothetical protein
MSIRRRSIASMGAGAVLAATVVLVLATPAGAVGRDAFTGRWVGVEIPIGDGSTDYMTIGGPDASGVRTWVYWETGASYCSDGGPLSASGTAQVVDGTLTVTVTFTKCANGLPGAFPPPFDISMFTTGDGHINWGGVIFSRAGTP